MYIAMKPGLESGGYPGEKACLEMQLVSTLEFNPSSGWIQSYRHTLANIDNPEYQWWLPGQLLALTRASHTGQLRCAILCQDRQCVAC